MEPPRISGDASGNSGTCSPEVAEIQSLPLNPTFESPPVTGTSFTAHLGLYPTETLALPFGWSRAFPSNAGLIERAARLSVFAAAESPEVSNVGEISPAKIKTESCDRPQMTGNKRKQARNSKVKGTAKKSKRAQENTGGDQKLPFVHVRAQRGQATDSHSLAERARREKINARMKLLQELVPGCNKISGTALVLEEIINHVQSLQRHVEVLSMRLAAVNPRIDLNGLDNFLFNEGTRQQQLQQYLPQMWLIDSQQQQQFSYDSPHPSSVPLANQLRTEI